MKRRSRSSTTSRASSRLESGVKSTTSANRMLASSKWSAIEFGIRLEALRDLGREDVEQERLDARLRGLPSSRERDEQQHRDERDDDDVEHVEGPDEGVGQIGAVRPNDFGESEREQDRGDEGCEPRPGPAGAVEGDCPEWREQRPQDHRARLVDTAEHDRPQRGRDEDQQELRRAQEREASGPREDCEADRRPGDISPRRERDSALAEGPVHAAPGEGDREDEERHADEEALAKALVGRVARIRADGEGPIAKRRGHDQRLECRARRAGRLHMTETIEENTVRLPGEGETTSLFGDTYTIKAAGNEAGGAWRWRGEHTRDRVVRYTGARTRGRRTASRRRTRVAARQRSRAG